MIRNLILVFSVVFVIVSFFVFNTRRKVEIAGLDAIIEQLEVQYEQSKKNLDQSIEHFKADYLNRVYAIEYSLQHHKNQTISMEQLQKLRELMQVESIHLVDKEGVIRYSSDQDSVGLCLLEDEKAKDFWSLIQGKSKKDVVQLHGNSILHGTKTKYIGIRSQLSGIAMLQIGISEKTYESFIQPYTIETAIQNIPTVWDKAIFAVDRDSGELVSITRNNEQTIQFKKQLTKQQFVEKLENFESPISVTVNGELCHLKTVVVDQYILGAYINSSLIYKGVVYDLLVLWLFLIIIVIVIYYLTKNSVRKFVLNDLETIDHNIQKLLLGDYGVEFKSQYHTEFMHLSNALNRWKESYRHKSERMTQIMESVDHNIAVFEGLSSVNTLFFSENLVDILGLSKEEEEKFRTNIEAFESYLDHLIDCSTIDGLTYVNHKYLKIMVFKGDGELYGSIMDKTSEALELKSMKIQLKTLKTEMYQDSLSNTYNRTGLEAIVKQCLREKQAGVLMMFDIDNFKSINDNEGHPKGDEVIRRFAQCLKQVCHDECIVARMGGDEFIVYQKQALSIEQIKEQCERILLAVRGELVEFYEKYKVSVSIGVASVNEEVHTYEALYTIADVALYIAKHLGKNTYYINDSNIQCMRERCIKCTKDCKKRKLLETL